MKLLPYDRFCIVTPFKPDDVELRLQAVVAPEQGYGFKRLFAPLPDGYFTGVAQHGSFKFMRIIQYKNSFLPVIIGHTESWLNGSRVYVKMRLQIPVAIFMCFWLGVVGIVCLLMLVMGIGELLKGTSVNASSLAALIPFGMFAFGYGITIGFYSSERNRAKNKLLELLDGHIDDTVKHVEKKL